MRSPTLLALACLALLVGCAMSQQQSQDNADCAKHFGPLPNCGGLCVALDLIQIPMLGICDGATYLRNLTRNAAADVHEGIYRPRDGRFSIAVPEAGIAQAGYTAQQLISGDDEYVFFFPSDASEPIYSAGVRDNLPEPDASESLDEYAGFAVIDSQARALTDSNSLRPLRGPLAVRLDGQPAELQVYAGLDENRMPRSYFLIYVSKDAHRAAFLAIASKEPCPHCASGTKAEMLADIRGASSYVASFHIADRSAKP